MKLLKRIFGKKGRLDLFNIHHPNFAGSIEVAFEVKGTTYYRFKQETKIPYGRYQVLEAMLMAHELRMDYNLFKGFLNEIERHLNGDRGQINLAKVFELIQKMKARAALAFDPEQAYKVASVVFFDETENLYAYDSQHNERKIALWKEAEQLDFFYTMPIGELLGLNNFSSQDLQNYLSEAGELLKDLTYDTQPA